MIVGPTSRTDQSDRPVGQTIGTCTRPVSRRGRVSGRSSVIPRGSSDSAETVDANSRSRAGAAVSHNMVGEQVVRRRTGNSQNNLSHKDVDSTNVELPSVGVMTRSQNRQMSDFKAKMHQIRFRLGLRPRHHWESLQRFPRPPGWI